MDDREQRGPSHVFQRLHELIDSTCLQCFVSEVSDYTFDMSLPHDAFRFFTLLQTPGSERFAEHMQETVALSREEAMEALLDPGYVSWKSIHWSHLDKGNGEGPDTHGWRVDVAKSMED